MNDRDVLDRLNIRSELVFEGTFRLPVPVPDGFVVYYDRRWGEHLPYRERHFQRSGRGWHMGGGGSSMSTNVIDYCGRLAEARRRREVASRVEFEAVASNIPQPVLIAILKAVTDKRPDAIMRLPSSWRKRTLAAWRAVVLDRPHPIASVVPFPKEQP